MITGLPLLTTVITTAAVLRENLGSAKIRLVRVVDECRLKVFTIEPTLTVTAPHVRQVVAIKATRVIRALADVSLLSRILLVTVVPR